MSECLNYCSNVHLYMHFVIGAACLISKEVMIDRRPLPSTIICDNSHFGSSGFLHMRMVDNWGTAGTTTHTLSIKQTRYFPLKINKTSNITQMDIMGSCYTTRIISM